MRHQDDTPARSTPDTIHYGRRATDKPGRHVERWVIAGAVVLAGIIMAWQLSKAATHGQRAADHALQQQQQHDHKLARQAEAAAKLAQQEAAGECYRVNYLRWNIDRVWQRGYQRDVATVQLLHHAARMQPARWRVTLAASRPFARAVAEAQFLPLTDCSQATDSPVRYRPPPAIPLSRAPRRLVEQTLAHPPAPPTPPR